MKNLYVGNLPHSTTEVELRGLFEPHGAVEKVSMVTDRETGRSRGFAFVEMTNAGEAEKAIAARLNQNQPEGRASIDRGEEPNQNAQHQRVRHKHRAIAELAENPRHARLHHPRLH